VYINRNPEYNFLNVEIELPLNLFKERIFHGNEMIFFGNMNGRN